MTELLRLNPNADPASQVQALTIRLSEMIDTSETVEEMIDILGKWQALKDYFLKKTNAGRGAMEAAQRRAEMRVGSVLREMGTRPDFVKPSDYSALKLISAFDYVVEQEISSSTNAKPCGRSRALRAIRSHRITTGELVPRTRNSNGDAIRAEKAYEDLVALEQRQREIRQARARAADRAGGTTSHLYQRVRQAQAELAAMHDAGWSVAYHAAFEPDLSDEIYERQEEIASLLVRIEGLVVEIMQTERRQEDAA